MTTSPRRASPASRAVRRSRRPAPRRETFLERNRTRLLWALVAIGAVIIAGLAFWNSTLPAYACTRLFDPTPAPTFVAPTTDPDATGSPAPAVTPPPPGYVQPDMGHLHVNPGTQVRYTYCPPASGKHYNAGASGEGPIRPGVYGPEDKTIPEGWVHNLEHAALVVLYRCPEGTGPGCTDAAQAEMEALFPKIPASPICGVAAAQLHVITRFDDMAWPYAALVWDVVLPLQTIDEDLILDFYARQGDRFNPEDPPTCVQPGESPAATESPAPASPSPATSPAASPAASPAGSPAASPAASPAPAS